MPKNFLEKDFGIEEMCYIQGPDPNIIHMYRQSCTISSSEILSATLRKSN